ncbi:MAG: hypothetical protein EXR45_07040 [Chloroflexi bacterium]|nr:hypothetical protein [Chloroflexota bacterium]
MDLQALLNPLAINPFDLFPTSPDAGTLMDAAERFPGGPVALVFVLFWSPWMAAIGIPAGLILARHAGINPLVTLGLYALTDIMAAMITHPLYAVIKRFGGRVAVLRTIGRWYVRLAMIGARPPRIDDVRNGPIWPALFRIGVVAFGFDIYHGGMVIAGLPVPRLLGWAAALAGDLIWFGVLFATSSAAAAVTDNDKTVGIITVVAMIAIPKIAEWIFPALRGAADPPKQPVQSGDAVGSAPSVAFAGSSRGKLALTGPHRDALPATGVGGGRRSARRGSGARPRPRSH